MKMIDADTVHSCISYPDLVNGLIQMHREEPCTLKDVLLGEGDKSASDNFLLVRSAIHPGKTLAVKMATIFPGNTDRPSVQAVVVLFDGNNGTPIGLVDGNAITHRKTATDSALGSKLLSRKDSKSFLMVGAGSMAEHLIRAHVSVRPQLQTLKIWNRSPQRAVEVQQKLANEGLSLEVVEDLADAVSASDIVCSATMVTKPIIKGEWLRPGCHLDLVGAYRPDMREADDDCLRRGKLFVDNRKTTLGEIGEIEIPRKAGVISEDSILGDFYDICAEGFSVQRSDSDITVFKNGGGGHLDLMTSRIIFDKIYPAELPAA